MADPILFEAFEWTDETDGALDASLTLTALITSLFSSTENALLGTVELEGSGTLVVELPAPTPTSNTLYASIDTLTATIHVAVSGALDSSLSLAADLYEADGNILDAQITTLTATIYQVSDEPLEAFMNVQYLVEPFAELWTGFADSMVTDTLVLSSESSFIDWVWHIRERFGLSDTAGSLLEASSAHTETLAFAETLGVVWHTLLTETLELSGTTTLSVTVVRSVVDTLVLAGVAGSRLEAYSALAQVLSLDDAAGFFWHAAVTDALVFNETQAGQLDALSRVLEQLDLGDTVTPSVTATAVVRDTLELTGTGASQLDVTSTVRDALTLLLRVVVNGDAYSAWVINTESKGVSRYSNYPFNSFAKLGGQDIAASRTGLYRLGGDTDDGEPITARIRSGLTDFSNRMAKRMPEMYLGYRAAGGLVLKVITTSGTSTGAKQETWYTLEAKPAADIRESRFQPGKGLKSVYWGWELVNVVGADFAVDSIEWRPLILSRRLT